MPWVDIGAPETSPIPQYSVSAYAKYRSDSSPVFTVYYNVQQEWMEDIKSAWKICALESQIGKRPRMLDHWTLHSKSLAMALEACRLHEAMYDLLVSTTFRIPLQG